MFQNNKKHQVRFNDSMSNDENEEHDESSTLLFPFIKKITTDFDDRSNSLTNLVDELNNIIQNPPGYISQHSDTTEKVEYFGNHIGEHLTNVTNESENIFSNSDVHNNEQEEQYEDLPEFDIVMDFGLEETKTMTKNPSTFINTDTHSSTSTQTTPINLLNNTSSLCEELINECDCSYFNDFTGTQSKLSLNDLMVYYNWNDQKSKINNSIEVIDKHIKEYVNHRLFLRKSGLSSNNFINKNQINFNDIKLVDDTNAKKPSVVTIVGNGFNIEISSYLKDTWNLKINIVDSHSNELETQTLNIPFHCLDKISFSSEWNFQYANLFFTFKYDSPYRSQSFPTHTFKIISVNQMPDQGKLLHNTLYNLFTVLISTSF